MQAITRIAPTPSGFLHLGNAYNFLFTQKCALGNHAKIALRIDDIDHERVQQKFVEDIFSVLHWLGINWEIGPKNVADFYSNWSQLHRLHLYQSTIDLLRDAFVVYPCICSRSLLQTLPTNLNCFCQFQAQKNSKCLRLVLDWKKVNKQSHEFLKYYVSKTTQLPSTIVIQRSNGMPSYHVMSITEDNEMRITHICRGMDLEESSAIQLLLTQEIGFMQFANMQIFHHPLLLTEENMKLSKSKNHTSLQNLRIQGASSMSIQNQFLEWQKNLGQG